jgi:hypothetical protein
LEGGLRGELGVVQGSGRDGEAALEEASSSSSHAASNSVKAGREIRGASTGDYNEEAGRATPVKAAGKCNLDSGRKTPVKAAGEVNQAPVKAAADTNLADNLSVPVSLPLAAIPQNGPLTVYTEPPPMRLKGGVKSLSEESGSRHGGTDSGAEQPAVKETVTAASETVTGSRPESTIRSGLETVLGFEEKTAEGPSALFERNESRLTGTKGPGSGSESRSAVIRSEKVKGGSALRGRARARRGLGVGSITPRLTRATGKVAECNFSKVEECEVEFLGESEPAGVLLGRKAEPREETKERGEARENILLSGGACKVSTGAGRMGVLGQKVEMRMTRRRSGEGAGTAESENGERRENFHVQSTRPDSSSPRESVPGRGSLTGDGRKEAPEQSPGLDSFTREDLADIEPELGNLEVKALEDSSKRDTQTGKTVANSDGGAGQHRVGKRPKLMSRKQAAILGVQLSAAAAAGPVGLEERLEIEELAAKRRELWVALREGRHKDGDEHGERIGRMMRESGPRQRLRCALRSKEKSLERH